MIVGLVRARTYRDSVEMMRLAAALEALPGVARAAALMATPANRAVLAEAGLGFPEADAAAADDLVIAAQVDDEAAAERVRAHAAAALAATPGATSAGRVEAAPRTLTAAVRAAPASLAVISVPGPYAAAEAEKAVRLGLDAFVFSDNVPIAEEVALKTLARARGRLVMGPDCGTAILGGVPLGFANAVRPGSIGLAGASGTGLQQVSCLIDRLGAGVSHVIGVGGRDLGEEVGGQMMLAAIARLAADPATEVIALVSKPPAPSVAARVLAAAEATGKPVIACFLGGEVTLEDCAVQAVARARGVGEDALYRELAPRAEVRRASGVVRGLYSGGTFAAESLGILRGGLGEVADLHDDEAVSGHAVIDLGADVFTRGRPHPMIDPRTRGEWIARTLADPAVGVVLLDVVIGHGAHADPAGAVVDALGAAGRVLVIASVCGTEGDAQGLRRQEEKLAAAGVVVAPSNAAAARLAVAALRAPHPDPPPAARGEGVDSKLPRPEPEAGARDRRPEAGDRRPEAGAGDRRPETGSGESGVSTPSPRAAGGGSGRGAVGPRIINIGLPSFRDAPASAGADVVQLDWRPPVGGDPALARRIAGTVDGPTAAANAEVLRRILTARPQLVGVRPARELLFDDLPERSLLHAGPPIAWRDMCGPMQGALIGAVLHEGWAADPGAARALLDGGAVALGPNHHAGAVGPMAGVISPGMPVWVVRADSVTAASNLNEGLGKVLRFGAFGPEVLDRLAWMRDRLGPALAAALAAHGPIDLKSLIAQALQMGDEAHNRCAAASALLGQKLAPHLVRAAPDAAAEVLAFLGGNAHFALNVTMAAAKATLDGAAGVPGSTVVTAMARNGVDFGIRLSGTGARWFTAPCEQPDALYFPGYGPADANPDLGDSAITECVGLGGFAMAAAPAIVRFVGGSAADALAATREMADVTLAENPDFALPPLDFRGAPTGIDARLVVESGVAPIINTGVAHREAGVGQIGAGIVRAPLACFVAALEALS